MIRIPGQPGRDLCDPRLGITRRDLLRVGGSALMGLTNRMKDRAAPMLDKGFSAFLQDMESRGLLEETLIVALGEFGRSPEKGVSTSGKVNRSDGRDHWPYCHTAVVAGAGSKRGYVHGESDATGASPKDKPVHPTELLASIYHAVGIDPETNVYNHLNQPRELVKAKPVDGLFLQPVGAPQTERPRRPPPMRAAPDPSPSETATSPRHDLRLDALNNFPIRRARLNHEPTHRLTCMGRFLACSKFRTTILVRQIRPLLLAAIITLCAPAAPAAEPRVLDAIAAVVNDDVVTLFQVLELTNALENSLKTNYSGAELATRIKEVRIRALNDLVDRQLILQEFKKMKGQIPPHAIDDRVNAIIREDFGGDKSAFMRTIAAQGLTLDRIRKMEEDKIIVQAMRSREVKNEPMLAPGAIERYYNQHIQEWTTNDEVKLRMIKINHGAKPAEKRKMAQEIREKIVRGADFADLARVYSEDSTQDKGGDWGWVKHGDLSPQMEQVFFRLQTGKVSDIVEMNGAFYLMLVEQKKGGTVKPLKELRKGIEAQLLQVERQKDQQEWLQRLRKKAFVKIY